MSNKLEKLTTFDLENDEDKVLAKLNAAIDRINELEAKIHNHTHGIEGGKHGPYIDRTTPPIPGDEDAKQ